jgi:hypothetical protein
MNEIIWHYLGENTVWESCSKRGDHHSRRSDVDIIKNKSPRPVTIDVLK